jgi:hypothetical protein
MRKLAKSRRYQGLLLKSSPSDGLSVQSFKFPDRGDMYLYARPDIEIDRRVPHMLQLRRHNIHLSFERTVKLQCHNSLALELNP